jgi:hypothetical protein
MYEEHNPVRIQGANRHNLPLRFADLTVGGHTRHSNSDSVLTCLRLHSEEITGDRVFQIVDSRGTVVMLDSEIRKRLGKSE